MIMNQSLPLSIPQADRIPKSLFTDGFFIICVIPARNEGRQRDRRIVMKRKIALLLLLILPFALCACGGDAPSAESLIFTTGNETGTYYSFGNQLARKVSSATTTFVAVVPSEGSRANIQALARHEAQLGLTQYDAMLYAREGSHTFQVNGPNTAFSVVAVLYPEAVHIVTLDPSIKTVADLAGKRVSVGAAGSGIYTNAMDILGSYGLTEKDIVPSYHPHSEAVDALLNGWIDAAFITIGAPANAVTMITEERPVYLVSLDEAHIDALVAEGPAYSRTVIPADVYGTPGDCATVAIDAIVVADNSVSEESVYDFVRGIYDNVESLRSESPFADYLSPELAASVTEVPYHPGAARYFAEHGITVPAG